MLHDDGQRSSFSISVRVPMLGSPLQWQLWCGTESLSNVAVCGRTAGEDQMIRRFLLMLTGVEMAQYGTRPLPEVQQRG